VAPIVSPAWIASRAGLTLDGGPAISFQRFLLGELSHFDTAPTSLGTLDPVADAGGGFLIPLHPGEGVWIGVEGSPRRPVFRAVAGTQDELRDLADGRRATLARGTLIPCEQIAILPGLPRPGGGYRPLADPGLRLAFQPAGPDGEENGPPAHVELVTVPDFVARTGRPPPGPADPERGYRGWRLP
jgi:hypothetical protein